MTMVEKLLSLADRCEKATGPDRELDLAISDTAHKWHSHNHIWHDDGASRYTASLDAAMTLVPEGWSHGYSWNNRHQTAQAHCEFIPETPFDPIELKTIGSRKCATPALALCAAALRARSA